MASHQKETTQPPHLDSTASDDDVMEALFTRGDTNLSFNMPYRRLFRAEGKGKPTLASRILETVIDLRPLPEDDACVKKARPHTTGGAHPDLSFTYRAPHDEGIVQVVVSEDPEIHQEVNGGAAVVMSPHQQPEVHIIPDPSQRKAPAPDHDYT